MCIYGQILVTNLLIRLKIENTQLLCNIFVIILMIKIGILYCMSYTSDQGIFWIIFVSIAWAQLILFIKGYEGVPYTPPKAFPHKSS